MRVRIYFKEGEVLYEGEWPTTAFGDLLPLPRVGDRLVVAGKAWRCTGTQVNLDVPSYWNGHGDVPEPSVIIRVYPSDEPGWGI